MPSMTTQGERLGGRQRVMDTIRRDMRANGMEEKDVQDWGRPGKWCGAIQLAVGDMDC